MLRSRPLAVLAPATLVLLAALLDPAGALAAQRWTSPSAAATTGACTADAPCRIDAAVNNAATGDEVIVGPGTYGVAVTLDPEPDVEIHGVAGQPRPWLVGTAGLAGAVVSARGPDTLRHLGIEATAPGQHALVLEGGLGEDLLLRSAGDDGAKIIVSTGGTVLRASVATTDSGGDDAALKLDESGGPGSLTIAGVTAIAPGADGIDCHVRTAQVTLVDTIARGARLDVDAAKAPGLCTARASSYRPALAPGLVDGGGNVALDPLFADAASGDYRQAAGSPTIDAGVADPLLGAFDLAGCPRPLGAAPDIGAYEQPGIGDPCAAGTAEPIGGHVAPPVLGAAPVTGDDGGDGGGGDAGHDDEGQHGRPVRPPAIGRHVVLRPARGHVRFRRPGTRRYRTLEAGARVPVGSVIDATRGRVRLASAIDRHGHVQTGTFWGARFVVRQSRHGRGMTTLALRGGRFGACRTRKRRHHARRATAAAASLATVARRRHRHRSRRRHRHHVVRSLWARDRHGRFRTHGANSVATARGTAWVTQDRCDGTRVRVTRGAVAVRDLRRHRTVLVRAGHAYLARRHR